jgi:hypothetical protein
MERLAVGEVGEALLLSLLVDYFFRAIGCEAEA